jgi:hypothetical protein
MASPPTSTHLPPQAPRASGLLGCARSGITQARYISRSHRIVNQIKRHRLLNERLHVPLALAVPSVAVALKRSFKAFAFARSPGHG